MRVVFYNPQASVVIGTTLYNFLLGIFSYNKYTYLVKNKPSYQKRWFFFIDENGTSLLPKWLGKYIRPKYELYLWLFINRLNPFNVTVITNSNDISNDDVLIGFSVGLLDNHDTDLKSLSEIKCTKIFHLTHFIQNTKLLSKNAKKVKINYFFAENNLYKNSPYFRKHFSWYKKDVYTLPFAFRDQFFQKIAFSKRKNKAMAIGTVVDVNTTESTSKFTDFITYYNTTIIQPIRYAIYLEKNKIKMHLDSYISEIYETKQKTVANSPLDRLLNAIFNATKATKRKYYTFNMTDTFNAYKMFINGEEINNLPGIGFVEGMACGSAYIGQDDPMYRNIGLIPNKHYIAYDGTLQGLIKIIKKYQKNTKELEMVARRGCEFVRHHFSATNVSSNFFEDLYRYSISNSVKSKRVLKCTFTDYEE